MRRTVASTFIVLLLVAACGHATPHGQVDGTFQLPGRPAADVQRGGLSFLPAHQVVHRRRGLARLFLGEGGDHGHVTRVGADGHYTVTLAPGSYTVIGALAGSRAGPLPETCAAHLDVVVTADQTTHLDYVCDATPVTPRSP